MNFTTLVFLDRPLDRCKRRCKKVDPEPQNSTPMNTGTNGLTSPQGQCPKVMNIFLWNGASFLTYRQKICGNIPHERSP
jgi:hypothetical protein